MELQERQVRRRLEEDFESHIDLSDYQQHSESEQAKARTTRALAALTVAARAMVSVDEACASVVDESNDQGIDAIGISAARREVYVVQTKTSVGGPSPTEVMKFVHGIRCLLDWDWDALGPKARRRRGEIEEVLADARVIAIFSYLGAQGPNEDASRLSNQLTEDVNAAGDILEFHYEGLRENFERRNIASGLSSPDSELTFDRWITMSDYRSEIMGIVSGEQLATLTEQFSELLFDKNIRAILRSTETNEVLDETLRDSPSDFWYYNNGITIVANSIGCSRTNPRSSNETFSLKGLSVVNGAQTCGALSRAFRSNLPLDDVHVTVRVISTAEHPEDFEKQVTRYTNTQNQVSNREFVALDPYQQELSDLLLAEKVQYSFRTGQALDDEEYDFAFDLEEATRALSCWSGVANATRAKREIGRMWADLSASPYLELFPRDLNAAIMYNSVRFWRSFRDSYNSAGREREHRAKNIVKNSEFMASALFMQWARGNAAEFTNIDWDVAAFMAGCTDQVRVLAECVVARHERENPGGFAMSFFKNQQKVETFARAVRADFLQELQSSSGTS
ncbi:AIPR family protein [Nocardioides aurantiacus]|uniref:AIPR protein n=1 Tax=Nocardioides aurantiacus TaxID=86796 RepID=A0A3N2CW78_9ACTN|nr:AIPR family protein [Nocardioides aurantiacus]ROR91815.1 AIPR protein [Nocardioides aurantiacus]